MKVKKYRVKVTTTKATHIAMMSNPRDVIHIYNSLDDLWSCIDIDEWVLEIAPYWEELTGYEDEEDVFDA